MCVCVCVWACTTDPSCTVNYALHLFCVRSHLILPSNQYENEACLFGRWGTTGLTRPNWCDSKGKIKQPKEAFEPPPRGWKWEGDWFVSPELSIAFEPDEGLDEWTEDIFENQLRPPFSSWPNSDRSWWSDVVSCFFFAGWKLL